MNKTINTIRKYEEEKEYAKSLISNDIINSFSIIAKTNNKTIIN